MQINKEGAVIFHEPPRSSLEQNVLCEVQLV